MLAALGAMMSGGAEQGIDSINKNVAADLMLEKEKRQREWKAEDDVNAERREGVREDRRDARDQARLTSAEKVAAEKAAALGRETDRKAEADRVRNEQRDKALDLNARRLDAQIAGLIGAVRKGEKDTTDRDNAVLAQRYADLAKEAREQNNPALASSYLEQANAALRFGKGGVPTPAPREAAGGPLGGTKTDAQRGSSEAKPLPSKAESPAMVTDPQSPAGKWQARTGKSAEVSKLETPPQYQQPKAMAAEFEFDKQAGMSELELARKYTGKRDQLDADQVEELFKIERRVK